MQPNPGGRGGILIIIMMLVVSLRGVNYGFWSDLGYSGQNANILSSQDLV